MGNRHRTAAATQTRAPSGGGAYLLDAADDRDQEASSAPPNQSSIR